ncbi:MAG: hypothetical protein IKR66_06945 [Bacteroidales bacterium]|nr:hypothetical protein [Bacteroidales bacterium]
MEKIKSKNLLKGFNGEKLFNEVKKYVEQVEGKRMDLADKDIRYNIFVCNRDEDVIVTLTSIFINEDNDLIASVDNGYDEYDIYLDPKYGNVYLESIIPIINAVEDYIEYVVNGDDED